jgi:hypothetical protein
LSLITNTKHRTFTDARALTAVAGGTAPTRRRSSSRPPPCSTWWSTRNRPPRLRHRIRPDLRNKLGLECCKITCPRIVGGGRCLMDLQTIRRLRPSNPESIYFAPKKYKKLSSSLPLTPLAPPLSNQPRAPFVSFA